jgi:hypothetical protein
MKTAEQFLEECKAKWTLSTPENAKQAMIEALKLYAEQAIDMCAEKVWDCVEPYDYDTADYYITEQPILDLKKQLQ